MHMEGLLISVFMIANHTALRRIFGIVQVPVMPCIPAHDGHIIRIRYDDLRVRMFFCRLCRCHTCICGAIFPFLPAGCRSETQGAADSKYCHLHSREKSLRQAVRNIKSHDWWQLNGRKW